MQAARPDPTAALTALSPLAAPRSANPASAGGFAALMQQAQAAPAPAPATSPTSARAPAREPARDPAQAAPAEASPSPEAPADPAAAQRRMTRAKPPAKSEGEAKAPDAANKPKPQAESPGEPPAAEAAAASPPATASDTPDASTAADPIPGTATPLALLLGTPIARNLPAAVSDPADTDDAATTALRTPALTLALPPGQADAAAAAATEGLDKAKAKPADKASKAKPEDALAADATSATTSAAAQLAPATEAAPAPSLLLAAATAHASAKALASDAANGRRGEVGEAGLGAGPIGAWAASASTWSNPTASTSAATATLVPAPGQADFAEALGNQVSLWVGKGVQEAQLQLNPKDMGPVQVWIALDNNAAQVRFAAEHSATREALQAALPELAQALARDGLQLGSASVHSGAGMGGQGGFAQARQQGDAPADGRRGFLPAQPLSTSPSARAIGSAGANLLDLYA